MSVPQCDSSVEPATDERVPVRRVGDGDDGVAVTHLRRVDPIASADVDDADLAGVGGDGHPLAVGGERSRDRIVLDGVLVQHAAVDGVDQGDARLSVKAIAVRPSGPVKIRSTPCSRGTRGRRFERVGIDHRDGALAVADDDPLAIGAVGDAFTADVVLAEEPAGVSVPHAHEPGRVHSWRPRRRRAVVRARRRCRRGRPR